MLYSSGQKLISKNVDVWGHSYDIYPCDEQKALGFIIKGLIFELFLVISQGPTISTDEKLDFRTDCYTLTSFWRGFTRALPVTQSIRFLNKYV